MSDFETYIKQGEPDQQEKGRNWQMAIGLQQVDGLRPSDYLVDVARKNIEGAITFEQVEISIDSYYKSSPAVGSRTEEADRVSARIAEILSERAFSFSPVEYIEIHRRLFAGIFDFAGTLRDYNIEKRELVLGGATVFYASAASLRETLEYDFQTEKRFSYSGLTRWQQVEHIVKFIADLWQIHPFGEGNTCATAVFAIKYLRTLGFEVENEPFAEHSLYFRNALVRANFEDLAHGVHSTTDYLMKFFGNILLGENNLLENEELSI